MIFECPECGSRLRGGKPGSVVACARCANPVAVPEPPPDPRPEAPPPPEAPKPTTGVDPREVARRLWSTAGIVLLVVALAHVGLWLLLTAGARSNMDVIEARHARADLERAEQPPSAPSPGTPEYGPWRRQKQLWVDAEAWRNDRRQVHLLEGGFIGSFLVQVGITLWILMRLLGKNRRRRRGADAG